MQSSRHHPQRRRASPSEGATQTSSTHSRSFKLDKTRRQGTFACVNPPPNRGRQNNHVRATRKSDKACLPFKFFGHAPESISGSRPLSLSRLPLKRSQCNSSCLEHACLSQLARFYGFCKCSQAARRGQPGRRKLTVLQRPAEEAREHGEKPWSQTKAIKPRELHVANQLQPVTGFVSPAATQDVLPGSARHDPPHVARVALA